MTLEENKKINALITFFGQEYKKKFGRLPTVNRNRIKYLMADILIDMSFDDLKDLIRYYVKTEGKPELYSFCYEYDEVLQKKIEEKDDKSDRRQLLSETQKRVQEFRERYGR